MLLIGLCPERKIYVQVIYLGHVPTKGDGEAGRNGKSTQDSFTGWSSRALGSQLSQVSWAFVLLYWSLTDWRPWGAVNSRYSVSALRAKWPQEPSGRPLTRVTGASYWKHRYSKRPKDLGRGQMVSGIERVKCNDLCRTPSTASHAEGAGDLCPALLLLWPLWL